MQLFILDPDPREAAKLLSQVCPLRGRKQIIETNQSLSTILGEQGMEPLTKKDGSKYSTKTHKHHPVTQWMRDNLDWVLAFQYHLSEIYPDHAASVSFLDFFKGMRLGYLVLGLDREIKFKYFGSFDAPGVSVFAKYLSYIIAKQKEAKNESI